MTPSLSYAELKALNPCRQGLSRIVTLMGGEKKWNSKRIDAASARQAGATFDNIIWASLAVARTNQDVKRRLRLWMADCAAHVLQIYERDYPADERPRNAIVATRQLARVEIGAAAGAAAGATARATAGAAAWTAAGAAAGAAAWDAAWADERAWQFNRIVEWLGDKEPDDYQLPVTAIEEDAA